MGMKEFLMKLVLNNIYANPDILKDETAYKILSDMIECKDCEKCHAKIKPCVDGKPTCIATVLLYYLKVTKTINGEANSHNQPEHLTDKEQRIFLAAMGREEKVCKEVDEKHRNCREPYEDSLVKTCHEIIRKVRGTLWA